MPDTARQTGEVKLAWSLSRMSTRASHRRVTLSALLAGASLLAVLAAPSHATGAGRLDRSFGGDGTVSTKFPARWSQANAVAIDARGRIVAAGTGVRRSYTFALARYKRSGHLDRSFGRHGRVIMRFGRGAASAVLIDSRGRIVVAGGARYHGQGTFALARYKPNGHLDHSFSGNGRVRTKFGGVETGVQGVAIDSHNRIVVAGLAGDFPDWDFALARYRRNGSLDGSFGAHGKVTTDLGMTDSASSVAIDSRDRIVVAGRTAFLPPCCGGTEASDFALIRYDRRGTPDPSFGTAGEVITDFGGFDGASSVALERRGRIVAAGSSEDLGRTSSEFALARYDRHGQPDAAFGAGGMLTTNFHDGRYDGATSIAIDSHNRIVTAGNTADRRSCFYTVCADSRFALARYGRHGALDHSFSRNGKVANPHGNALSAAIDSRDRIVAAGVNVKHRRRFKLARYIG